jgi:transposase InsO family protein
MIISLIDEAVASGARRWRACETVGLSCRTLERWRAQGGDSDDRRHGPKRNPKNKLSDQERSNVLSIANSPEYRDLSPKQIVPQLADKSTYVASESTFYRILHEEGLMAHRQPSRPATHKPRQYTATGAEQVLSWDITYLRGPVKGLFFYLYMFVDIWSRKILGWAVHETESTGLAAQLLSEICSRIGVDSKGVVLHSDNGSPMKGSTMLATIQALGLIPSFSRPHVSDDNPYSESIFRTMKYRPWYPLRPFASLAQAIRWVEEFVRWYNEKHLHSAIEFVTPNDRHSGADIAILDNRRKVYAAAQNRHPERWSRHHRQWNRPVIVTLNPDKVVKLNNNITQI